jgi:hypothetical protein
MIAAALPSHLALEIHFDADPIEGRVSDPAGALDQPFRGWLGLMAAIESARTAVSPASPKREAGAL